MDISYQIPRNALVWILLAVALVIAPQSLRMPVWISVIASVCIAWRILIYAGLLDYPSRMMRVVIVVFTLLVSVSQVRTIGVGLDSAASLLALGFVFKLIEMRQKRDIYVVISLCFVMAMVAFLYDQSVVSTLYISVCIIIITAAMVALNRSTMISDSLGTLRLAMRIGMQALPLTIVLFLLFPRIAPLWAVPMQTATNSTGVSDEMSPGDISQLGRSGDLAFRVKFEDAAPPLHENLYWRGLVLDDFDGLTWRRTRRSSSYSNAAAFANFQYNWEDRLSVSGEPIHYNVIMEPTQEPWIYGLHLAEPQSDNLLQSRNFEMFHISRITQRLSYDLQSYQENQTDLILLGSARRRSTQLPEEGNLRSHEFAQQLRASVDSDLDYAYAVLGYFQQNPFFYTLNPDLLDENRIDDFLFNTMQGFCEHYASSFAFLMRAVGIPTRVVVGYQGAEYNRFEDYMMVYQYNAHAWNEVWIEGEGWMRFDPTAAVSPERIQLGVEEALRDDPSFMQESLFSRVARGNMGWLNTMRLRLDAIEYEWNRRVVNYDEEIQFELFEQIFGEVTERKVLFLLISLGGIVLLAIAFTVIRLEPRYQRDPIDKLYRAVCAELEKSGLGREPGEGPVVYRNRVLAARPDLREPMLQLTEHYLDVNYRTQSAGTQQRRLALKVLRQFAKQIRLRLSVLRHLNY